MQTLIIPFDSLPEYVSHEEDEDGYVEAWAKKDGSVYQLKRAGPSLVSQHERVSESISTLLETEYEKVQLLS